MSRVTRTALSMLLAAIVAALAAPAVGSAATIGNTTAGIFDRPNLDQQEDFSVVDVERPATTAGSIAYIHFYAKATGSINLFIVDSAAVVKFITDDIVVDSIGRKTVAVPDVPISVGDRIGYYTSGSGVIPFHLGGDVVGWSAAGSGKPTLGSRILVTTFQQRTYSLGATLRGVSARSKVAVVADSTNWLLGGELPGTPAAGFGYGTKPLTPIMGDWDGNGTKTVGTFERGTFRLNNENDSSAPDIEFTFGDPRGYAVAGDFDGNGTDDVAVYRSGTWQVHYLGSGPLPTDATFSLGAPFGTSAWPATVPVAGDWDGDGTDGIGTYSLGSATWVLKSTAGPLGVDRYPPFVFGDPPSSYPVVGDWYGVGFDTPGFRNGSSWTVRDEALTFGPTTTFTFGPAGSIPLTY